MRGESGSSGGTSKKKARLSPRDRKKAKKATKAALAELRGERQKKSKQKKPHDALKVMRMAYANGDVYEGPLDVDDEWHGECIYLLFTVTVCESCSQCDSRPLISLHGFRFRVVHLQHRRKVHGRST